MGIFEEKEKNADIILGCSITRREDGKWDMEVETLTVTGIRKSKIVISEEELGFYLNVIDAGISQIQKI